MFYYESPPQLTLIPLPTEYKTKKIKILNTHKIELKIKIFNKFKLKQIDVLYYTDYYSIAGLHCQSVMTDRE